MVSGELSVKNQSESLLNIFPVMFLGLGNIQKISGDYL